MDEDVEEEEEEDEEEEEGDDNNIEMENFIEDGDEPHEKN